MTLTLNLSEAVTVAGGTPTLTLNDGGTATYTGGTGTNALTFSYTVAAGQNTADLAVTAVNLNARDRQGWGRQCRQSHRRGDQPGRHLQIDTTAPAAPTIALAHDTGASGADGITRDPAFTHSAPQSGDTLRYSLDGGSFSATVPVFATDGSADGSHTVSVVEVDGAGNSSAAASLTFRLDTTAPHLDDITASPAGGNLRAGSTVTFVFDFNEAVSVTGGTPTLQLNNGGTAVYNAAATAALHDATRIAFDYLTSGASAPTTSLAITGLDLHGATVSDVAGNHADIGPISEAFALAVNQPSIPAYTINGFTRPALYLDSTGHIILDAAAAAVVAEYGTKFLYLGVPASTPYPPVADVHQDFHLV